MNKRQLQDVVNRFLAATPKVIIGARGPNGTCKFCGSPRGTQHSQACPTWGLIHARIEHHLLSEGPVRSNEDAPDPAETMGLLEAGADLTPTAPTLQCTGGESRG